ncbi:MAG: M48 family metallopeptidase [Alphaproteobacteria bacterium]|nr:M48 family metallopeptidase [Alphaproteobacteria bacterium]
MRSMIALLLSAVLLAACQSAPVTGRSQVMLVSEEEERQMGLLAFRQVQSREPHSHDIATNDLVAKVGARIASAVETPPPNMWKAPQYRWEFEVVESREVNAACLPGGKIVVYTGILPVSRDEAGMATVMGHEVAHALARHSAERLSDQKLIAAATVIAAVGLATNKRTAGLTPAAMAAMGLGARYGIMLPMNRTQESEADHIGLILMALAGYDPHEAIGFWERMLKMTHGQGGSSWSSTHPSDAQRIADIKTWVPEAMKYYRPQ